MTTKKAKRFLVCWSLFLGWVTLLAGYADTLKLKNGTVLEGIILEQDAQRIVIEVHIAGGTIAQKKTVNMTEIAEVVRLSPERKAEQEMMLGYVELQKSRLDPSNNLTLAQYDVVIEKFLKFRAQYPNSLYEKQVGKSLAAWQAERDAVALGKVKHLGRWLTGEEAAKVRLQNSLEKSRALLVQGQFEPAVLQLDMICISRQHPEVVAEADALRLEAYTKWLSVLNTVRQQLLTQIRAQQQRLSTAKGKRTVAAAELKEVKDKQEAREIAENQRYYPYYPYYGSYWIDSYGNRRYYYRYPYRYQYGGTTPPAKRLGEDSEKQVAITSADVESLDAEKQLFILQPELTRIETKITEIESLLSSRQRR